MSVQRSAWRHAAERRLRPQSTRPGSAGRARSRLRRSDAGSGSSASAGVLDHRARGRRSRRRAPTTCCPSRSVRSPAGSPGPFGSTAPNLHVGGLIAVLTLMFVSYVLAVRAADRLSGRAVLMTIAAFHALMLLAPPLLSTDVFSYQAYARMGALYGANPYLHGPHAIALDPLYPFIGAKWVSTPSAYGPVFTALSYVLAPLSIAASALAYKAIAALSSLRRGRDRVERSPPARASTPVKAAALVGLNPLLVVYGVGGGHNDLLMLAVMLAGIYALLQHRERAGGGMMIARCRDQADRRPVPAVRARRRRRARSIEAPARHPVRGRYGRGARRGARVRGVRHRAAALARHPRRRHRARATGRASRGSSRRGSASAPSATPRGCVSGSCSSSRSCWLVRKVWRGEMDWIDGAGWTAVGRADHRELDAPVVRRMADAARRPRNPAPPVAHIDRDDGRRTRDSATRIYPSRQRFAGTLTS